MALEGRLTKDKFGFNQPVDAPLYSKPPIYYKNVEAVTVAYETDPEAAADLLPEGLVLTDPAMASLMFVKYPFSTLGAYLEVILGVPCTLEGEGRFYIAHIVVDTDMPQAGGREIWGFPKKIAAISIEEEADIIWGKMERPTGHLICSAGIRPETPVENEPLVGGGSVSLRVIPSPEEGAEPSVAQLVETPGNSTPIEAWTGTGWAQFHSTSLIDPWHKLEVREVLNASYRKYDMILGFGKIVKTY